jgi:hypothetical protein
VNAEFARLVIARGQDAASISRATDPHGFTTQRRPITHLDRRVKAIHVQVNDRSRFLFVWHSWKISHKATRRPFSLLSVEFEISRFAMSASLLILATVIFS